MPDKVSYNVVFTAPILNLNALPTIEAITSVKGAQVTVISQEQEDKLPSPLRGKLHGFIHVENALDETQLLKAVEHVRESTGRIDRLFASNEQVQVPVAVVREQLGIKGMPAEVMRRFRDKSLMKSLLAENDLPCARFKLVTGTEDVHSFASQTGYPIIAKPPEGAGAEFTYLIENAAQLEQVLGQHPPDADHPMLLEEFITGDEHSFDTFTVKGKTVWYSVTRYLPSPLDVKRNPWIQWRVVLPREIDDPQYDAIRRFGVDALEALGAVTGISHMEWFRRPDGSVAISEVGMRPPGAQFTTLMSRAFDFDCLNAWAKLMITGRFTPPVQKYAAGCAYLRGQGNGVVREIHGFDRIQQELGAMITDYRLPEPGQPASGSYEGEGFVILRHEKTQTVEDALLHIISNVRVVLG